MSRPSRARASGFTVIEVLVALAIMTIGLAGIMAIQRTAVKGDRDSRQLDRAKLVAEREMEQLRGKDGPSIVLDVGAHVLPDEATADGTIYHRSYEVAPVAGNLYMVTVVVRYAEEGDETDLHTVRMQMMRTAREAL